MRSGACAQVTKGTIGMPLSRALAPARLIVQVHAAWPRGPYVQTREGCTCTLHSPSRAVMARLVNRFEKRKSGGRQFPPPLFAVHRAYAAGWLSSLVLSWVRVLRAVRSSAARTATAAGSSIRSGSPCRSRERRASCAPALRISARSSGVSGRRGGRRVSRLLALLSLTFFRSGLVGILSVRGQRQIPWTNPGDNLSTGPG